MAPGARRCETHLDGLPAAASTTVQREPEAEAGKRGDVVPPIVAVFSA
jgi:hypothetical protein